MQRMLRKSCIIMMLITVVMFGGCQKEETVFHDISEEELEEKGVSGDEDGMEKDGIEKDGIEKEGIFVHVCGEVVHPGVYELKAGSRVYEAVKAAGGMSENAAQNFLNQAEILEDGQQIYVPSEEEISDTDSENGRTDDGKVNLNQASKEQLMTLPGVGEAKADAIIRYRSEKGDFRSIEEIMEIEGIKEGVFKKIEDWITVS